MGPGAELVAIGQSVTVVVVFGVARVKGVGEGPLARVRERPLVEVASGLLLEAVLYAVAVGVLVAGIGLDRRLDGVRKQITVEVRAVATGGGSAAPQCGDDQW